MVDRLASCNEPITLLGFMISRNKSEPTFTRWSKEIGKVVIYKARHEGNVNFKVRIADPLRNEDCSTANLRTRQTEWYSVKKPLVHSGRKKRSAIYRTVFTYGNL